MQRFLISMVMGVMIILASLAGVMPVWAVGCTDACVQTNLIYNTEDGDKKCYCPSDASSGSAIGEILMIVLNILSGLVLLVAVIGVIIAGVQYLTARDNDAQVVKAKRRLFQIVIGLVVYALMWAFLNWLVPGGVFNVTESTGNGAISESTENNSTQENTSNENEEETNTSTSVGSEPGVQQNGLAPNGSEVWLDERSR